MGAVFVDGFLFWVVSKRKKTKMYDMAKEKKIEPLGLGKSQYD